MTAEEILHDASGNTEFCAALPDRAENYVKTIVAFANTQGGRLVVGVDDKTGQVTGIEETEKSVFEIMDSIAHAADDLCSPRIAPTIEPQTMKGRTVVVVTVTPGPNRPYYLKAKGMDNGTYIRSAGTTRPASPNKIIDLVMEGKHVSWDELTCVGYEVTKEAVDRLCRDIMSFREKTGLPKRNVTEAQLVNWKLLNPAGDSYTASNAFVLLTSDYFPFSKTQCAVFKGTGRSVFLDKREYTGPIYDQIEEAVAFVLRNIRLGAQINGLLRKESYELPVDAIREMIVNAHCHRNLTDESCVQVAIYDDRLEVTSPGGLYNGLTYEDMMDGHSRIRNRAIANVFSQMGLSESWGTGIRRITEAAADHHLPVPEFAVSDGMFRVNLFRGSTAGEDNLHGFKNGSDDIENSSAEPRYNFVITSEEARKKNAELNVSQLRILELLSEDPKMTAEQLAPRVQISKRSVESNIKALRERGILIRHGANRGGYWEVIQGARQST